MECLEFKRLALSDPNSKDVNFVEHADTCPCCLKYIGGVREMDSNLASSLDVEVPSDLLARLELNQITDRDTQSFSGYNNSGFNNFAKAAGIAAIVLVGAFLLKGLPVFNTATDSSYVTHTDANQATEGMIYKVVKHMEDNPMNPIWGTTRANKTMKTLLASYEPSLKLKDMDRLQFIKICSMDEVHDALHANLETSHGQITFAYVKGHPVGEVKDTSYKGYYTRIKPIGNGSLVIIGHNMQSMEEADVELEAAMHWDL